MAARFIAPRRYDRGNPTAVAELRQIAHGLRPSNLDDGLYQISHVFSSADRKYTQSRTCYSAVDTEAPEFLSIDVEEGQHYVGDTVTITVKVGVGK